MNPNERGIAQPKEITRREALGRISVFAAAAALVLAGCTEIELPPGAQYGGRPQAIPEPQIDEGAARDTLVLSTAAILALLFLRGIK